MTEEPENLVLKLLREIREKQDAHDEKFQQLGTKLEELTESVTYSLGLSAHANVRLKALEAGTH